MLFFEKTFYLCTIVGILVSNANIQGMEQSFKTESTEENKQIYRYHTPFDLQQYPDQDYVPFEDINTGSHTGTKWSKMGSISDDESDETLTDSLGNLSLNEQPQTLKTAYEIQSEMNYIPQGSNICIKKCEELLSNYPINTILDQNNDDNSLQQFCADAIKHIIIAEQKNNTSETTLNTLNHCVLLFIPIIHSKKLRNEIKNYVCSFSNLSLEDITSDIKSFFAKYTDKNSLIQKNECQKICNKIDNCFKKAKEYVLALEQFKKTIHTYVSSKNITVMADIFQQLIDAHLYIHNQTNKTTHEVFKDESLFPVIALLLKPLETTPAISTILNNTGSTLEIMFLGKLMHTSSLYYISDDAKNLIRYLFSKYGKNFFEIIPCKTFFETMFVYADLTINGIKTKTDAHLKTCPNALYFSIYILQHYLYAQEHVNVSKNIELKDHVKTLLENIEKEFNTIEELTEHEYIFDEKDNTLIFINTKYDIVERCIAQLQNIYAYLDATATIVQ